MDSYRFSGMDVALFRGLAKHAFEASKLNESFSLSLQHPIPNDHRMELCHRRNRDEVYYFTDNFGLSLDQENFGKIAPLLPRSPLLRHRMQSMLSWMNSVSVQINRVVLPAEQPIQVPTEKFTLQKIHKGVINDECPSCKGELLWTLPSTCSCTDMVTCADCQSMTCNKCAKRWSTKSTNFS